jgi:hypothetical protein
MSMLSNQLIAPLTLFEAMKLSTDAAEVGSY